jgi:hypothetical protein
VRFTASSAQTSVCAWLVEPLVTRSIERSPPSIKRSIERSPPSIKRSIERSIVAIGRADDRARRAQATYVPRRIDELNNDYDGNFATGHDR